jgi:peptidyl-prolyl cis-trans isomerase D
MTLLNTIRKQGWIMVALVAVSVFGFIAMDVFNLSGNQSQMPNNLGKVNGQKITREQLDAYVSEQEGTFSSKAQAIGWERLVQETILEQQTLAAGLSVGSKEMGELFVGTNMSYIVQRRFQDQNTGMVDRNQVRQMVEQMENPDAMQGATEEQKADAVKFFKNLQRQVYLDRLSNKYVAMLQKATYTPKWMASSEYNRQNQTFDLSYVRVPYTSIDNAKANVTDEELKKYIQDNSKKYKREATANIEFVLFDVKPSGKDSADYKALMDTIAVELRSLTSIKDDSAVFIREDGEITYAFLSKDDMDETPELKDSIFAADKGATFGPYIHNNAYKLVKIMGTKELADSVRYRRITYPFNRQDQNSFNNARKTLDSLKTELVKGKANFDSLVRQYSQDIATKDKGGDVGFIGREIEGKAKFGRNDYFFFQAEKDSFYVISSPEGDLQIVQVTGYKLNGKKGLRLGVKTIPIVPSENTTRDVQRTATEFLQNRSYDQFVKAAQDKGLRRATANGLEVHGYEIVGLGENSTAADIIAWAHTEAKDKEVAKQVYAISDEELSYTRQFVAPVLVAKFPAGVASLDDANVRQEVDKAVRNKKKAEVAKTELAGAKTLEEVSTKFNTPIEESKSLGYGMPLLNSAVEQSVVAVADLLQPAGVSTPIAGEEGIYIIRVNAKNAAPALPDTNAASKTISQRNASNILSQVFEALREKATIVDNRIGG